MYSACVTEVDENLKEHLLKSLEFINWKNHVKTDYTVFIKSNELIENGCIKEEGRKARKFVEKYVWSDVVDGFKGILGRDDAKILQVTNFFKPSWESDGPARVAYEISKKRMEKVLK